MGRGRNRTRRPPKLCVTTCHYCHSPTVSPTSRTNEYFPHPIPALDDLDAHIDAAEAAQVAALTREIGKAAALRAALSALRGDLERLQVIVQGVANLSVTDGKAIVTTSGMSWKESRGPSRADFAVRQGRSAGMVILLARAIARKASYYWQYSLDGKRWRSAEPTLEAKTTLSGLTPATRYYFRFRAKKGKMLGDWSQVISLIVS
jgi:fibronectin type III domain protein